MSYLDNPLLLSGVIGLLGIIAAFLVTRYYYLKGSKEKIPYYAIKTSNLVADLSSRIAELVVLYGSDPIRNLTVAKVAFWNCGK